MIYCRYENFRNIAKEMHLTVKLLNSSLEFDLADDASVEQLRTLVAAQLETEPDKACLVFKGRIMRDKDSLSALGIVDGASVHCVLKKSQEAPPAKASESPKPVTRETTNPAESVPLSFPGVPNLNYLESIGDTNEIAVFL